MRFKLLAALMALPLTAGANAADVYAACEYSPRNSSNMPITQLFTLEGNALRDYYGEWTYEKNLVWEKRVPVDDTAMRLVSGSYPENFVGQFTKFAESKDARADCYVTTDKQRAFAWYRKRMADGRFNKLDIQDWRPTQDSFVSAEQWPPN